MVLSQISTDGGFMDLARHSSPARAANRLNADWPDVSNCCLRIMWATSMPSSVAEADLQDFSPFICRVNFLMKWWSCSIMLFRYFTCRTSISQNHPFKISTQFMFCSSARFAPLLSFKQWVRPSAYRLTLTVEQVVRCIHAASLISEVLFSVSGLSDLSP